MKIIGTFYLKKVLWVFMSLKNVASQHIFATLRCLLNRSCKRSIVIKIYPVKIKNSNANSILI